MKPNPEISVIIPAYQEQETIQSIINRTHQVLSRLDRSYEIIVVNDGSSDATAEYARRAKARVLSHPYNMGNGAAVKTGIRNAQGDIMIMFDADGQHAPEDIPRLLEKLGPYDMVVAARTSDSDTSFHRDIANRIYNSLATYVCGQKIEDLTSGFRALKANVARGFIYLLPNTFSYPTTITLATVRSGRTLTYVPIRSSKRVGKSKINLIKDGTRFLLIILKITTFFSPLKVFMPTSMVIFLLGFFYGLFKVLVLGTRYGPTSAMLMTIAIVVFLMGLVSEQVAQLRFDRSEFNNLLPSAVDDDTALSSQSKDTSENE